MSKRKILTLALAVCMIAILAVGSTLAYLTDTDQATNTFTVGKVDIELIEQQRNSDGSALEKFVGNKKLYPVNGSAQGVKDKWGLPTAENYVDKIITVKNLEEDAYVRVYFAVPAALENLKASKNVLHWNWGNKFSPKGDYAQQGQVTGQQDAPDYTANMEQGYTERGTATIDGILYNVYSITYKKVLTKNEVTGSAFFVGIYLDKGVDFNGTNYTLNGEVINYDLSKGVEIPVVAIGAQAEGFTDADVALNAAFGANYNPWNNN